MMMAAVLKAVMDGQQSTDTEEEEEETDDSPNYESNDDEERTFVSLVCNGDPDTVDMLLEGKRTCCWSSKHGWPT